jgi:hypothetical protein
MKKHFSLLALSLVIWISSGFSQSNLVPNNDFENYSPAPTGPGLVSNSTFWNNCNGFTAWPWGTPDLFTADGSGGAQWPNTFAGNIVPQSGSSCVGFITYNVFAADYREYVSCNLLAPMAVGETYTVSFWLSNAVANYYGGRGSNNLGIAFSMGAPMQVNALPIALVPQVEITSIVHHAAWVQYVFSYTATHAYTHMTVGNFRNDAATSNAVFTSGIGLAYYFLDNMLVVKSSPLAAEAVNLELGFHIPEDALGDEFVLERSRDQRIFTTVNDFGVANNPGADVRFVDAEAYAGVTYYYRLRDNSSNGDLRYSPLVEAKFGQAGDFVVGNVYPNPVRERLQMEFAALKDGDLALQLINSAGQMVYQASQPMAVGQSEPSFLMPSDLGTGLYQARFTFEGKSFTKKILYVGLN